MKSINFKESSAVIIKNSVRTYLYEDFQREIKCMNLSIKERVKLLITGKIWLETKTLNNKTEVLIDKPNFNK